MRIALEDDNIMISTNRSSRIHPISSELPTTISTPNPSMSTLPIIECIICYAELTKEDIIEAQRGCSQCKYVVCQTCWQILLQTFEEQNKTPRCIVCHEQKIKKKRTSESSCNYICNVL